MTPTCDLPHPALLGRNVARARLGLGWSRRDTAAEAGAEVEDLADLENGRYEPDEISWDMIDWLGRVLDIAPSVLAQPDAVDDGPGVAS